MLLPLAILAGCTSSNAAPTNSVAGPATPEVDVLETVFRHLFGIPELDYRRTEFGIFFLSLADSADPPPELLARFSGHTPSVEPGSACAIVPGAGTYPRHRQTGVRGVRFTISRVRWIDKDTAEVHAGYHVASRWASRWVFRVGREARGWVVRDTRFISGS